MPILSLFNRAARVSSWTTPKKVAGLDPSFFDTQGNGFEVDALRLQFKIDKNLTGEPNTAEVTITNAAPDTRTALCKKPSQVRIEAGYQDTGARLLFTGDLRFGTSVHNGTDWDTKLQLADGGRAISTARARRSFAKPISAFEVMTYVATTLNLKLPPEVEQDPELRAAFANGVSVNGASRDVLTRLLAPYGYGWSVQNGRLQIIQDGQIVQGQSWVISKETGMIGYPRITAPAKGTSTCDIDVDVALFPELTPGQSVKIESEILTGVYKLIQVVHEGDTRGDDWKTSCKCRPL